MKSATKIAPLAAAGLLVLAGYGGWRAWDNGHIPGNARATNRESMLPAIHRAAYRIQLAKGHPCIGPESRVLPDAEGETGIAQRAFPGQHSVIYLTGGGIGDAETRERILRQYAFLANEGYFAESNVMLETDAGPRPAKRYQLTWDGFAAGVEHGRANCFQTGVHAFVDVKEIQKLPEKMLDLDIYEVVFESRIHDPPSWTATVEAKNLFPKLAEYASPRTETIRLLRGKEGWLTEADMELQVQSSRMQAGAREYRYLMDRLKRMIGPVPPLDREVMAKALDEFLSSGTWLERGTFACLPMRLRRGGDERNLPFDRNGFTATWYDESSNVRRDHERRTMLSQLHVLSALESVGFATLERVAERAENKARARSGLRYTLTAQGLEAADVSGLGCLPAGHMDVEGLSATYVGTNEARLLARAKLSAIPDWVRPLAEHLPALKSLITEGVPLVGTLEFADDRGGTSSAPDTQQKWQVTSLAPAYPEIAADRVPAALQPYLPATTLASATSAKAFLAGAAQANPVRQASASNPELTPQPSAKVARVYGPMPPSPIATPAPRTVAPRKPPYPAGDMELHLVSIYDGEPPAGDKQGSQERPEGIANIVLGKTARPVMLMLVSHSPVQWRIAVEPDGKLARVLAIGMYDQRVTIIGTSRVEVISRKSDLFYSAGIDLGGNGFPYEPRGNQAVNAAEIAQAIAGKPPATFQGRYTAYGAFTIDSNTRPLAPPASKSIATLPPAQVSLRSLFPHAVSGLSLTYGGAGGYTQAWSSRALSAGKAYFEGIMEVEGLSAVPFANIGIGNAKPDGSLDGDDIEGTVAIILHGEQRLYKNGDVFGVAVDFDAGIVYCRINGQWTTGPPGTGAGKRFKIGRELLAYFYASGGDHGRGLTGWRANFGTAPFRHPVPEGYISWDGSQRG